MGKWKPWWLTAAGDMLSDITIRKWCRNGKLVKGIHWKMAKHKATGIRAIHINTELVTREYIRERYHPSCTGRPCRPGLRRDEMINLAKEYIRVGLARMPDFLTEECEKFNIEMELTA